KGDDIAGLSSLVGRAEALRAPGAFFTPRQHSLTLAPLPIGAGGVEETPLAEVRPCPVIPGEAKVEGGGLLRQPPAVVASCNLPVRAALQCIAYNDCHGATRR